MQMFLLNLPTCPFRDISRFLIARVSRKEEEQAQAATLLPTHLCLGLLPLPAHHLSVCPSVHPSVCHPAVTADAFWRRWQPLVWSCSKKTALVKGGCGEVVIYATRRWRRAAWCHTAWLYRWYGECEAPTMHRKCSSRSRSQFPFHGVPHVVVCATSCVLSALFSLRHWRHVYDFHDASVSAGPTHIHT